ncbi:odorant receptor 49b-like [Odontomachus brunneus]|uniref:odorant receptor 49b-like n=1 Tax=Odontomachus brunneus TaxID=486640 RepID=UPI0013F1F009|nr:odorant receptor 49b-like [Odontomachus brunneus]
MFFVALYANLLLLHLYMYCYSAEKLITESTGIAYSVYECKWYDLPTKYAKDLMLIVYRSMIPLRLTAGKFNTFSIELFGSVRYLRKEYTISYSIFIQRFLFYYIIK